MEYSKELEVARVIARQAGKIMLEYFNGDQRQETKSDGTPVTIADKLINSLVIAELLKSFPDDGVIGEEESTTEYGMGRIWFCDPIDGTIAFIWGTPTSMFSLGLVIDGEPKMGVAYDPYLDKMYSAIKSKGAFCNDIKINASNKSLEEGVVAITSRVRDVNNGVKHIQNLAKTKAHFASFSGAVYKTALVARGRFIGFIEEAAGAHDMAAIGLIVEEAGGVITDFDGRKLDYSKPFKGVVVSNGVIHQELLHSFK